VGSKYESKTYKKFTPGIPTSTKLDTKLSSETAVLGQFKISAQKNVDLEVPFLWLSRIVNGNQELDLEEFE
jgi:hypothetical protein